MRASSASVATSAVAGDEQQVDGEDLGEERAGLIESVRSVGDQMGS